MQLCFSSPPPQIFFSSPPPSVSNLCLMVCLTCDLCNDMAYFLMSICWHLQAISSSQTLLKSFYLLQDQQYVQRKSGIVSESLSKIVLFLQLFCGISHSAGAADLLAKSACGFNVLEQLVLPSPFLQYLLDLNST